jgi:hypothetical protein
VAAFRAAAEGVAAVPGARLSWAVEERFPSVHGQEFGIPVWLPAQVPERLLANSGRSPERLSALLALLSKRAGRPWRVVLTVEDDRRAEGG